MARPKPGSEAKFKGRKALQLSHSNDELASQPVCRPDEENDAPEHDLRQETPNRNLPQKTLSKQQEDDESKKEKPPEPYLHQRTKKNSNNNRSPGPRKPLEATSSTSESSEDSDNSVSSGQSSPRPASLKLPSRPRTSKASRNPSPGESKVGHVMWPIIWGSDPYPLFLYRFDSAKDTYEAYEIKTYHEQGPKKNKNKHLTADGAKKWKPCAELHFVDMNNETTRLPEFSYLDCRRPIYIKREKLCHMREGIFIMIPEDRLKVEKKLEDIHMVAKRPSASVPVARPGMLITDKGGTAD